MADYGDGRALEVLGLYFCMQCLCIKGCSFRLQDGKYNSLRRLSEEFGFKRAY